ncbi:MAG: FAD-dependent oxidoreductase, partial [Gammaproteobacteria bacterium]
MKSRLVLVGNGMAGVRTLEELLKVAPEAYDMTVFGAEPYGNYNRILLSPLLAGEKSVTQIMLNDEHWYAEHGITLHKGTRVVQLDRARRQVVGEDGTVASYDRLVLATGSDPFVVPVPGVDLPGVFSFRNIQDVQTMLAAVAEGQPVVVIGGGLLGLEAANGLMQHGARVTVVHLMGTLMERQLDPPASALLKRSLEARGLHI